MLKPQSKASKNVVKELEELKRREKLEVLREYLTEEGILKEKDKSKGVINYDHLKKLARVWKLHHEPGFWKKNPDKDALVWVLHQHISENIQKDTHVQKRVPRKPPGNKRTSVAGNKGRRTVVQGGSKGGGAKAGVFKPYGGDIFGERGNYVDGMIYLSRMQAPGGKAQTSSLLKDFFPMEHQAEGEIGEINNDGVIDEKDEKELKRKCAAGLYNYSKYPGSEIKMVTEGSIPALLKLVQLGDEECSRYCSAGIVNLSTFEDNDGEESERYTIRKQMLEEAALATLAILSRAKLDDTKLNSAMCFNHLSVLPEFLDRLFHDTAMGPLLSLLNSEDEPTKQLASMSLINLAGYDEDRPVNEDVLPCLGNLARSESLDRRIFASNAIRNLSCLPSNHARIMEGGAVSIVAGLVENEEHEEIRKNCCVALTNLTCMKNGREKMIKENAVQALVALAKMADNDVKLQCALALSNLACNSDTNGNVLKIGVIPTLLDLSCEIQDPKGLSRVAASLANLSANAEHRKLMLNEGAHEALIALAQQNLGPTVNYDIMTGFCNLSAVKENCIQMAEQDMVDVIIKYSSEGDASIKLVCANALCNFTIFEECIDKLLDVELVPALIKLAENEDQGLKQICAGALNNLAAVARSRGRMVKQDVVPCLIKLAKLAHAPTKCNCATTLCSLTYDEASQAQMIKEGVVDTLIALSKADSNETRLRCAGALCNLSRNVLEGDGLLTCLLAMSRSENVEIMHRCAAAFFKLSCLPEPRAKMAADASVAPGMIAMMRSGHGETQLFAAKALCNMSTQEGSEMLMLNEGAVKDFVVIALLRVNNEEIKEICSSAFFNLMRQKESRMKMIKEGVLWAIIKLSKIDSEDTQRICAKMLFNLTFDQLTQDTLMEISAVRVIAELAKFDCDESRKHCAGALMKLSWRKGDEAKMVEEGAIAAAKELSTIAHEQSRWNCATVLCNLSFHVESRKRIVNDDAVESIINLSKTEDIETTKLCAITLCNLSYNEPCHMKMVEDGASTAFIGWLKQFGNDERPEGKIILRLAATGLYNISTHVDSRAKIIEGGGVPVLIDLTTGVSRDNRVTQLACKILTSVSWHEPLHATMIDQKAVPTLMSLALLPEMQQDCAVALCNLSGCTEKQVAMVEDQIMDAITSLLMEDPNDVIRQRCAAILRNLSNNEAASAMVGKHPDLMKNITDLTKSNNPMTRQDIAVALANYCRDHGLDALEGAISTLIQLSKVGNEETQQICGVAVYHLSGDTNRLEDGSVSALLSLMDHDKEEEPKPVDMGMASVLPPPPGSRDLEQAPEVERSQRDMAPGWDEHTVQDERAVPDIGTRMNECLESVKPVISYYEGIISKYEKLERDLEKVTLAELQAPIEAVAASPTVPETSSPAPVSSPSVPPINTDKADELMSATDPGETSPKRKAKKAANKGNKTPR